MEMDVDLKELIAKDYEESRKLTLPFNITIKKAEGSTIIDTNGNKYLDCTSNFDNNSLGYNHKLVTDSIQNSSTDILYVSNLFNCESEFKLTAQIKELTGLEFAYYSNSKGEANNTALNIVKTWVDYNFHLDNKFEIISLRGSHSTNMELLSLSKSSFNLKNTLSTNLELISSCLANTSTLKNIFSKRIAAVIIDPLRFINGYYIADNEMLSLARKLCDRHNSLLVFDITRCALGRTGAILPYFGVIPDILTMSSGISQGIPLGVTAISSELQQSATKSYKHPYGYSATACHIASNYLEQLKDKALMQAIEDKSTYFIELLSKLQDKYISIIDIYNKGLTINLEMDFNLSELVEKCFDDGIILELVNPKTIRITPPFVITEEEINQVCGVLDKNLNELCSGCRLE